MQDRQDGRRQFVGRRPSVRLLRFLELLDSGMRATDAAREVGVSTRTGSDWAKGIVKSNNSRYTFDGKLVWSTSWKAKPQQAREERAISARFLSVDERIQIADLHRERMPLRQIAQRLGRAPSTVSRELRRNAHPGSGDYRPWATQRRAARRRARPKPGKIALNPQLREAISDGLRRKWSPEQISRRLRRTFPGQPEMHVTHETIYQALYVQGRGELRRELAKCLRTGRAVRKPQRRPDERRHRFQAPMLMISERPAEADDRAVLGHWEGDLILGARHQSAIATLVERSTRYVMLAHLPDGFAAEQAKDALIATISTLPEQLRRTLTWDQGTEMGAHHLITMATDMPIYFCDPGSPWQRGSNENTNGLLRQYFPKGTDFKKLTPARLNEVATELNDRPRKTLDWDTPAERLAALLQA